LLLESIAVCYQRPSTSPSSTCYGSCHVCYHYVLHACVSECIGSCKSPYLLCSSIPSDL